jgi:hypothetical protein
LIISNNGDCDVKFNYSIFAVKVLLSSLSPMYKIMLAYTSCIIWWGFMVI